MNKDMFVDAVKRNEWATTDEMIERLDEADFWSADFASNALLNKKRQYVRQQIKRLKDEDGMPMFINVVVTDDEGNEQHVYKQEALFDLNDYRKSINYHVATGNHHIQMASHLKRKAFKRFHVQIPLPFELPEQAKKVSK